MAYIGNVPADKYSTLSKQTITGDGGTVYTLDYAVATAQDIEVFVNNVRQEPGVAYTVSGTALTMTGAVSSSDDFYVVFQGKAVQTTTHPSGQNLQALDAQLTGDLKLETSSGGIYTITGTDTATNRTLTLPDEAGTVLTSASSIPSSQITGSLGGLVHIATKQASGSTAVEFIDGVTGVVFDDTYSHYVLILKNWRHSATGQACQIQITNDGGSTYETASYRVQRSRTIYEGGTSKLDTGTSTVSFLRTYLNLSNSDAYTYYLYVDLPDPSNATSRPTCIWRGGGLDGSNIQAEFGAGYRDVAEAYNGFKIYAEAGANVYGEASLYGVKTS